MVHPRRIDLITQQLQTHWTIKSLQLLSGKLLKTNNNNNNKIAKGQKTVKIHVI